MKIVGGTINIKPNTVVSTRVKNQVQENKINQHSQKADLSRVSFGALYNVKVRNINIPLEKTKLLKGFNEYLESSVQSGDIDDMITSAITKALASVRAKLKRKLQLVEELENLVEDRNLNPQQKNDRARIIKKELSQLDKSKISKPVAKKSVTSDEAVDCQLVNNFRSAVSEDDFNLRRVFKDYYQGLNEIKTVEELKEKYPSIKVPNNPIEVIAKKLAGSLNRDFYEKLDEIIEKALANSKIQGEYGDAATEILAHINETLGEKIHSIFQMSGVGKSSVLQNLVISTNKAIMEVFSNAKLDKGLSSIAQQKKQKLYEISQNDLKLLAVDYDDFVLSTIRKHYLESQKINDIVYDDGKNIIQAGTLKEPDYKFEKLSEKIKKMMSKADEIRAAQRNYDAFDENMFKERLSHYANTPVGNNDVIFERIVAFDTSSFAKEDIPSLKKFLRELDSVQDGEKTIDEAVSFIQKENIRPVGTERLNEIEKQKTIERLKIEQQKAFQLSKLKKDFDSAINRLYEHNLTDVANTCSKYRPQGLDEKTLEDFEYIMRLIDENVPKGANKAMNKLRLESGIMRWDTFNAYKKDANNPVFQAAVKYATKSDGTLDIDKAGKYLINSEIIDSYPESLEFVRNPDILAKVIERNMADKESSIRYMCKYDDYSDLVDSDRKSLLKFIDIFDTKDVVEKSLLKEIIEKDYVNADTTVLINDSIPATIASRAKQALLDKYKFPLCLDFMKSFEEALSSFASETGVSGIKKLGRNNKAIEYKMELKIKGHDDRLFSSNNDYIFDVFSEKGLH